MFVYINYGILFITKALYYNTQLFFMNLVAGPDIDYIF